MKNEPFEDSANATSEAIQDAAHEHGRREGIDIGLRRAWEATCPNCVRNQWLRRNQRKPEGTKYCTLMTPKYQPPQFDTCPLLKGADDDNAK